MLNSMEAAIIRKDLKAVILNKRLFPVLLIVPLVLTIMVPSIFILVFHYMPTDMDDFEKMLALLPSYQPAENMTRTIIKLILNNIMPIFFMIVPIMAASVTAASSFVGEKEKKTLETLLYGPLTLRQIFKAKVLSSFMLSMLVSLISFLTMFVVIEVESTLLTGSLLLPDVAWVIVMLIVAPAVSLLAVTLIVSGSAKAETMEDSQQRAIFLILPLLLLIFGQFSGLVYVSGFILLGMGLFFAICASLLMRFSMKRFTYETLLK